MKRERSRAQVALSVERPSEGMGENVLPMSARPRARRVPSAQWRGLDGFLAALPRVLASPAANRDLASGRARTTFGDDAA